jgi:cell division protein FtsB
MLDLFEKSSAIPINLEGDLGFQMVCLTDDRKARETYGYLEARIEKLEQRIVELESENEILHSKLRSAFGTIARVFHSRPSSY